jgi:hypothetical protein
MLMLILSLGTERLDGLRDMLDFCLFPLELWLVRHGCDRL